MEQKRFYLTRKKVIGFISLCFWVLAFIFACLKDSIFAGRIVSYTLGIMTYPITIIMSVLSLAMFMGFSYTRNKKTTCYLIVALISLIVLIHSISTFGNLEKVVDGKSLIDYLKLSYQTEMVFGAVGALLSGCFAVFLGEMGTIVLYGIITTLFAGLFIDYNFYGKYEEPVKKLKGHKIREKVHASDKKRTSDGRPYMSFDKYSDGDIIDTISVSEKDISSQTNQSFKDYSSDDIVDSIELSGELEPAVATSEADFGQNDIFGKEIYPDVFSKEDADKHRKKFLDDTWGNFETDSDEVDHNFSFGDDESESVFDNFGKDISEENDEISNILSGSEDEEESSNLTDFEKTFDFSSLTKSETQSQTNDFDFEKENKTNINDVSFGNYVSDINNTIKSTNNRGFGTQNIGQQSQPKTVPFGTQNGMVGVRYNPPPLSLLKTPKPDKGDYNEEQKRKSVQLENVLAAFNIPAKVQKIVRGPKITRYELSVPLGVSVKKIPNYENDIAAALSARAIVIRAPIPGTPYVGIELENDSFTSVYERELLESPEFQNAKDPLPIAIGKDISGEIIVKSLAKMVHLLIAGSTGSGKSVFIHNIVLSLIYKLGPEDLRLIMIDPKRVEFNRYNGLPHLLTPEVVMGSEKAINALKWCVKEMDRRYDLMSKSGYNNIEPYNKSELVKAGQFEKFPYIVIIVDELAEIMAVNKKDVELCIQRLTQLARACGMHLILATQRPSVDIISGVIKNNVPSRIAFSLQSGIDSKTILNTVGAEKLLGQGDMLFSPTGTSTMPRLQAAYASDEEIKAVIDYDKKYNKASYDSNIESAINAEQVIDDSNAGAFGGTFDEVPKKIPTDSFFKTAVKLVMANGGASTSFLQRRLSIGFARAGRIIDQMEEKGYIAASNGSKLRQILITPEKFAEDFGEDFNSIDN